MKKMAGFAAAVFLGLMLTGCQGTQKAEQSGYKVFCRNAEATALREVQYEPEAEGGEKLVEELLSAMEGTFNRNDYQSVFPEGLTAAVSTLKDGRLTIDFNDAYKQMDDTREVLLRAAVVQTMTQITDVREVVFTVAVRAKMTLSCHRRWKRRCGECGTSCLRMCITIRWQKEKKKRSGIFYRNFISTISSILWNCQRNI